MPPREIAVARFQDDETDDILPLPYIMSPTELIETMHIAYDEERKARIALDRAEQTLRKARIRAAKTLGRLRDLDAEVLRRMRDNDQPLTAA